MFDQLIKLILRYVSANLIEILYKNKKIFALTFTNKLSRPQFELSICFDSNGKLSTDPPVIEHQASFTSVFENMERQIYSNKVIIDFFYNINSFSFKPKSRSHKNFFNQMKIILKANPEEKEHHLMIFSNLTQDIS